jgi:hypothetical protein
LFRIEPARAKSNLKWLVNRARSAIDRIRHSTSPAIPLPDSPAALAFDPYVTRQLSNTMPLQALTLPSQEVTWESLGSILDGFDDLSKLLTEPSISSWKVEHLSRVYRSEFQWYLVIRELACRKQSPLSFVRPIVNTGVRLASTQCYMAHIPKNTFYNGAYVFGEYPAAWLAEHFFCESLGLRSVPSSWTIPRIPDIQQRLIKVRLCIRTELHY